MRFAVFEPPNAREKPTPVLWFLSGLTCTEENFVTKAGAQKLASELGLTIVSPDTSPRGAGVQGEEDDYDLGTGAGFYLDATQDPWRHHYNMYQYITKELREIIESNFQVSKSKQSICGHSMGGHGALTIGLKNPGKYRSISAFSPICAPSQCDWGKKAFNAYLGDNTESWKQYDANELICAGHHSQHKILIDQGEKDSFLADQLNPELFKQSCKKMNQALTLRYQPGYDHSYYFISTFMADHLRFHASLLGK